MSDKQIQQSILNKSRKDKFLFVLTLPKAMQEMAYSQLENRRDDRVIPDSLHFSVYSANLPAVRVDSGEVRFSGHPLKFSTHSRPTYENVTVNFAVDSGFNNYWVIWKWLDIMNDAKEAIFHSKEEVGTDQSMFELYQGTATMYALDGYNKEVARFDYIGVVPVALGSVDYNYRDSDEIETSFEFSFSKLTPTLL